MMNCIQFKTNLSLSAAVLLASGAITVALSQDGTRNPAAANPSPQTSSTAAVGNLDDNKDLSPTNIIAKIRLAYASLSTYRDTGWTVHEYQNDAWTNRFSELLGTRTCYRVEVLTAPHPFTATNRFWSDGLDNYAQHGTPTIFKGSDLDGNLSLTVHDTVLPTVYFNLLWGNVLHWFKSGQDSELVRLPDEKVGDSDCYVVARTTPSSPETLWVGKQDFLIRRYRKHATRTTETHENIVVNETFDRKDYLPASVR